MDRSHRAGRVGVSLSLRYVVWAAVTFVMLAALSASAEAASGSRWSVEPIPNMPSGATSSGLNAIFCFSSTSCMAVGNYGTDPDVLSAPFAAQLVGGRWSSQIMPRPSGAATSEVFDVSCASTVFCVAGGDYFDSVAGWRLLAEHWDGTSWSIQAVPEPSGATESSFGGVSCPSSSFCTGIVLADNSQEVVRWDGTSWSFWQSVPDVTGGINELSCTSSIRCTLVAADGKGVMYVSQWDGSGWSTQTISSDPRAQEMFCTSSRSCIAVGYHVDRRGFESWSGERWDGTRWSTQPLPVPPQGEITMISGFSCASSTACTMVGSYTDRTEATRALAERWDGRRWSVQTVLPPIGQTYSELVAVSCPTTTSCTALGDRGNERIVAQWTAIVPPSNQFNVRHIRVHRNGSVEFDVTVPHVGQLDVLETNWTPSPPRTAHTLLLRPGPHRYALARRHLDMVHTGTLHVIVQPSALGARQVRHHYRPVRINLWVTYQPTGGTPANAAFINLLVTR